MHTWYRSHMYVVSLSYVRRVDPYAIHLHHTWYVCTYDVVSMVPASSSRSSNIHTYLYQKNAIVGFHIIVDSPQFLFSNRKR
jgi:hypothetical protein